MEGLKAMMGGGGLIEGDSGQQRVLQLQMVRTSHDRQQYTELEAVRRNARQRLVVIQCPFIFLSFTTLGLNSLRNSSICWEHKSKTKRNKNFYLKQRQNRFIFRIKTSSLLYCRIKKKSLMWRKEWLSEPRGGGA